MSGLRSALAGMWKEKWINLLSVLSIGVGLFILLVALFTVYNLNYFASKLQDQFSMTVYLDDGISQQGLARLEGAIKANPAVRTVSYISKDAALGELKKAMKDSAYLFEGLDGNPLPASIEIRFRRDNLKSEAAQELARQIKAMQGVQDVQYGAKFLEGIERIITGARSAGIAFLAALLVGVLFVCYSTVKILFYRRKDEVETLSLLGAGGWFIRAPFLVEGSLLGLAGGLLACFATYSVFGGFFLGGFASSVPVLRYMLFPAFIFYMPLPAGLFIGFTGALIALGRIRI
ncbi:MAG: permease-like cell division protein FtsX [Nitrospiraceae bacterium]|nr:permease-like cell division protein FtsX [Nitrospiraceae bacterium]